MLVTTLGVVNPTQSNPGDTIEADDINTPVNQLAAVINGTIETTNLADNAVTTAKVADGSINPAKWTNPYRFRVYRNAAQSVGAGLTSKVSFDAESYDTNSNFDSTTNNRYVAPITGTYHFNAAVTATVDGGNLYFIALYKNGSVVSQGGAVITGAGTAVQTWVVADAIELTATDYVEIFFKNGSGGSKALVVGTTNTYFSGHLVSKT